MSKANHITLLIINILVLIGSIAWSITEPSYEPFIAVLLSLSGLVGIDFYKRKKGKIDNSGDKTVSAFPEEQQISVQNDLKIEIEGAAIVNHFPQSTLFFDERFCEAFPGVRGIRWFNNVEENIQRLLKLLSTPLAFVNESGMSAFHPLWWWRDGNMHIEKFSRLDSNTVLLDHFELMVEKIAAVNTGSYYRSFVYIQTKPMPPVGLYDHTQEDIQNSIELFGYCSEEYGIYEGKHKVTRSEYDDGSAMIEGMLTNFNGKAELRIRHITPYNIVIAPFDSPINNSSFDGTLRKLMDGILKNENSITDLVDATRKLPKR